MPILLRGVCSIIILNGWDFGLTSNSGRGPISTACRNLVLFTADRFVPKNKFNFDNSFAHENLRKECGIGHASGLINIVNKREKKKDRGGNNDQ